MIYQMKEALIGFPGSLLLDRVSMEIRNTEKICIVGRNGCGKTTLLKVIAGKHETDNLDSDEDYFIHKQNGLTIGYLEQMSFENETVTVRAELMNAYEALAVCRLRLEQLEALMEREPSEKIIQDYSHCSEKYEMLGGYRYISEMEQMFTRFGFDISDMERPLNTFSGGQKTKLAFVKLLLSKPDICLLDEPTNHLDLPTIEWLESYLKTYEHAVIIVSHDRMFLDRIADVTYEIEYKKMKRYVGNYTAFVRQKQLDYEKQCKDYAAQQKEIERLTLFIEQWKNTPTKVSMTRSKKMQIEHMVKIPKPRRFDTKTITNKFQPQKNSAAEVLTVRELRLGYETELARVSFSLRKGQRLAVIGENGRGKSTLLKTLVGQIPAFAEPGEAYEEESICFGRDVEMGYFDQELLNLNESKTVIEEFWDTYPTLKETEVRTILGNFLFTGDDVYQPIKQLSGGEKVRLSLAKLMKKQANLLILDEPTNHLDMVGKEALENILKDYQGTLLFVSHDRYFIRALATELLVFEHGEVNNYPYDYETYLERNAKDPCEQQKVTIKLPVRGRRGNESVKENALATSAKTEREETKDKQRRERRKNQLEEQIKVQEELVQKWKMKFTDPKIASDYEKLDEIQKKIDEEEEILNTMLMEWAGL